MRSMVTGAGRKAGSLAEGHRRSRSPASWPILLVFCLFTAGIGVQQARAQTELTAAACVTACTYAWTNLASTLTCGACIAWGGRALGERWLGEDGVSGWSCAKAGIDC